MGTVRVQRRRAFVALAAIAAAHAPYAVLVPRIGFVTDDFLWLADAGRDAPLADHALSREPFGYLRPLFHVLVVASRAAFGLDPLPMHAVALAASIAAGWLAWCLCTRLCGDGVAALCGALLLVWHPANASALGWISSLPSLLAAVGVLGTALAWHRHRTGGSAGAAFTSVAAHALALAAKEEAIVAVAWLAAIEWLVRRSGGAVRADGRTRLAAAAHTLVVLGYLAAWRGLGPAVAPHAPAGDVSWFDAAAELPARIGPLFVERGLVGPPFALLLIALGGVWVLRDGSHRREAAIGFSLAVAALVPSSVFLARFPYDKLERLLHPALPGAALAFAAAVATARARSGALARTIWLVVVLVLVPFAVRSIKNVCRRAAEGERAAVLLAALQEHGHWLGELAANGGAVRLRGYPGDWVYPAAPARAVAPELTVLVDDAEPSRDVPVLSWDAEAQRFRR